MRQTTTEAVSLFPNFHVKQLVSSQIKCTLMLLLIKIWKKRCQKNSRKNRKSKAHQQRAFPLFLDVAFVSSESHLSAFTAALWPPGTFTAPTRQDPFNLNHFHTFYHSTGDPVVVFSNFIFSATKYVQHIPPDKIIAKCCLTTLR